MMWMPILLYQYWTILCRYLNIISCFIFPRRGSEGPEKLNFSKDFIGQVNICVLPNSESSLFVISRAGGQLEFPRSLLGHCFLSLLLFILVAQLHWQKRETESTQIVARTDSDAFGFWYDKFRAKQMSNFNNSMNNWISSQVLLLNIAPRKEHWLYTAYQRPAVTDKCKACHRWRSSVARASLKERKIPWAVVLSPCWHETNKQTILKTKT